MKIERDRREMIQTSLWGIVRGVGVRVLIHPLDVIRTHQQSKLIGSSFQVSKALFRENGAGVFFLGFTPQLVRTSLKQAWVWPLLTYSPSVISITDPLGQLAVTGLMIAVADATISTPLERAKIGLIVSGKKGFSIRALWKDGWNGYLTHLSKLTLCWSTFLVGQKFFKDRNIEPGMRGSSSQLCLVALKTTLLVSIVSAPLDFLNTQKFTNNISFSTHIRDYNVRTMYRGWPLNFTSLLIQNIASIWLIDQLERR